MIIDNYIKAVLTVIAISMFIISLTPWIAPSRAQGERIENALNNIAATIKHH
jgi:hypothetical protein